MNSNDIRNALHLSKYFSRTVGGLFLLFFALFFAFGPDAGFKEDAWNILFQNGEKDEGFFVKRVVDGDTIELANGDRVRYIGVDTPESVKPNTPVECFAKEAMKRNQEFVEGKKVRLVRDVSDVDTYGRLLRYVYVGDIFVNEVLVREGYARVSTFPPDVQYAELFLSAEQEAHLLKRGLWADGACEKR